MLQARSQQRQHKRTFRGTAAPHRQHTGTGLHTPASSCFSWPRVAPNISPCSPMHANHPAILSGALAPQNSAQELSHHHPEPSGSCHSKFEVQVQGNNTIIQSSLKCCVVTNFKAMAMAAVEMHQFQSPQLHSAAPAIQNPELPGCNQKYLPAAPQGLHPIQPPQNHANTSPSLHDLPWDSPGSQPRPSQ